MSMLLRKLKSFFVYDASNSSNSTFDKTSALEGNTLINLSLKVKKNPEDKWIIIDSIGDGAFGKIYKAQHRRCKKLAALKQVVVDDEDDVEGFCSEVKVLGRVKHKNIVDLFEAYYYESKIWMFLEYCQIGSVDSIMQELERPLSELQISCILMQLCHALTYLHESLYIIHRDVKAANVLLNGDACIKLADFGVSAICDEVVRRNSFIGSPYWMAPEVINCETNKEEPYDFMVDIWSLGIMSIEMAQMDPPWNEINPSRVTLKILRNDPPTLDEPEKWSQEFKSFLNCCLRKDPRERQPSSKLLKHKFLLSSDLSPLNELIAEMGGEIRVECIEEEEDGENEEEEEEENEGRFSPQNSSIDDLEKEYYPNFVISTNIDEEMARHSLDLLCPSEAPNTSTELTSLITSSAPLDSTPTQSPTKPRNDTKQNNNISIGCIGSNLLESLPDHPNKSIPTYFFSDKSNDLDRTVKNNVAEFNEETGDPQKQLKNHQPKPPHLPHRKRDDCLMSNENFSFGQSSLDSRSSQFPANFSSIGKKATANQKKGKRQQGSGNMKEGLKVALFGALAMKQRLIGRSAEEGRAVELYSGDKVSPNHFDGDSNDGDISSIAMTTTNNDDYDNNDDNDNNTSIIDCEPIVFKRNRAKYKSLTKTRMYTYEGRPMTSQMSKVVRRGQEERSRRDRHNRKMDMRAMQLLQLTENKHTRNLVHHLKKQTRDLEKDFKASVKKCLKSYKEDLDRLTRSHKQSTIRLQLHHDEEYNEIYVRVKVQQDKDFRSLQSMLKMELKHLKADRRIERATIDVKERENKEVMRTYGIQQREHLSRLIDQSQFKLRVRQANLDNNYLVQKHDLYRACEGSIWKLEEAHLTKKKMLAIERHKNMHELQVEQAQNRHSQELELLTRSQVVGRSDLARRHEEEEMKFSKQLKQQKRQRTLLFKALNIKNMMNDSNMRGRENFNVVVAVGDGDSGYMSLEKKQIEEFERNERRRIDETFRVFRLQLKREVQVFEIKCREEVQEMHRLLKDREKRLILLLDGRLTEEESKHRHECVRWQRSLVNRKRIIEEELERQKNRQERFFRYVLRSSASSHHPDRHFFETYDRNFESRNNGKFALTTSKGRQREFDSLDLQRSELLLDRNPPLGNRCLETKEMISSKERLYNSSLYKSTPDFIGYWSGLDESLSSDEDFDGEVDSGYGHRRRGRREGGVKKYTLPSAHSDDEISTCL